ncbi:MAG: hypothetical protein NC112_08330 [Oxalobacter formigenes]|nr:hypothetical protein [Oxalobacter formigenes]
MTTIEEILERRMRRMAPKEEKRPVSRRDMAALAVPLLWAFIFPVDRAVVFLHLPVSWAAEGVLWLTALAFATAAVFSPREDVISWEQVPEPWQRGLFFAAAGVALAGTAALWFSGLGFPVFFDLALASLTLLWLALPFPVLAGGRRALQLLLSAMRVGMVWWTVMFLLLFVRDGAAGLGRGSLPIGALSFLGLTYWWFLSAAKGLLSDETDAWLPVQPGWQRRYWLGLALCACLVLLWVLTGFTNDGNGVYGGVPYRRLFPFYDVAALLEPLVFSEGGFFLLHAVPWQALFFPGESTLALLSGLHWLGLFSLAAAIAGLFAALYAGMVPCLMRMAAPVAFAVALAAAWRIAAAWQVFAGFSWQAQGSLPGGVDEVVLAGQHVPALVCALAAACFAAVLWRITPACRRGEHAGHGQAG